jgi:hypothetical protein
VGHGFLSFADQYCNLDGSRVDLVEDPWLVVMQAEKKAADLFESPAALRV